MSAPKTLYVLADHRGVAAWGDIFTSKREAKAEQAKALTVYNERLSLRTYKLQPVRR